MLTYFLLEEHLEHPRVEQYAGNAGKRLNNLSPQHGSLLQL
jgi:hypothetical protein